MAIFFIEDLRDETQLIEWVKRFAVDAQYLANHLIDQIRAPYAGLDFSLLRQVGIRFADVEDNVEKLKHQVQTSLRQGRDSLPCLPVGELPVPVSTEWLARSRQTGTEEDEVLPTDVPIDEALDNAGRNLAPFIAQRVGSTAYLSQVLGGMGGAQMLSVVVHSLHHGDRVSYSPAYFVNYSVLASPTTPVQGVVDPGTYIFMVTSPGRKPRRDHGVFPIPPKFDISLQV